MISSLQTLILCSVAVTTLDSLEKVAAPWRNAANTDQDQEEEEHKSQPAAPEPEELPGKHISGVAVNFCKIIVWSVKIQVQFSSCRIRIRFCSFKYLAGMIC